MDVGYNVKNSTLQVTEVRGAIARCKCSACGQDSTSKLAKMIFSVARLEEGNVACPVCTELNSDELYQTHKGIYEEALINEMKWNEGDLHLRNGMKIALIRDADLVEYDLQRMKIGTTVGEFTYKGELTKIKGRNRFGYIELYTDKYYIQPIYKCNYCSFISFDVTSKCPICSDLRKKYEESERKLEVKKMRKREEKNAERLQKLNGVSFPHTKIWVKDCKDGSTLSQNIKKLEELNNGYKVVDVSRDGLMSYKLVCNRCGYEHIISRANQKIKSCEYCETKKPTEYGRLLQNYIGTTINGLEVVSQSEDTFECQVKCIFCGRQMSIDLYDSFD